MTVCPREGTGKVGLAAGMLDSIGVCHWLICHFA